MKWHLESWRKLYRTCPPSWLRLSVSARGLGSELLKYCEDDGTIDIGDEDPGVSVAYMLGARPREHRRIREDVAELLADGYLVFEQNRLRIRNFVEAQDRTPGAKRTADWRARKTDGVTSRETSPPSSHVTSHVTSHVQTPETTTRSDPTRSDPKRYLGATRPTPDPSAPAVVAEQPKAQTVAEKPSEAAPGYPPSKTTSKVRETGRETPATAIGDRKRPSTRMPPEAELDGWLSRLGIPSRSDREVAKFIDYHLSRGSVMADWSAAWRTWARNASEFAARGPQRGRAVGGLQPQSDLWRPKAVNDPEDPLPIAKPGELSL